MVSRTRISGENAYKNTLEGLKDVELSNKRDKAFINADTQPFNILPGSLVVSSKNIPIDSEGEDGDIWFVIN
jgi:hypothetical protein